MTQIQNTPVANQAALDDLPARSIVVLGPNNPNVGGLAIQKSTTGAWAAPGVDLPLPSDSFADTSFPAALVYTPTASQLAAVHASLAAAQAVASSLEDLLSAPQ